MKQQHEIEIQTVAKEEAFLPHYASSGAAGADIKACISEDLMIPAGGSALIPTGLRVAIPEGYEIQIRPRSGLALKNQITVLNTPGTIDSDYRGEIGVILINHGKESFTVTPKMRIAQIIVAPFIRGHFISAESQDLASTARGVGGFGHTGIN
jgi:dUTP pyrophosphatase